MPRPASGGFSLIELLFTLALAATVIGIAVPMTSSAVDHVRTAGAARNLAARIGAARIDAVRRGSTSALRFVASQPDYLITAYVDGNGNGVRNGDITSGVDQATSRPERLADNHPGVRFGLRAGIPDLDGGHGNQEGVRIGASRILSLSPNGSATSGTLYLHGRRSQYAVRVLGATGRVRVFHYDEGAQRWINR